MTRGPYFVEQPKDLNFQTSVDTTCTENCPVRTVSFNCEARGYPQPKYEWYEDIISGVSNGPYNFVLYLLLINNGIVLSTLIRNYNIVCFLYVMS